MSPASSSEYTQSTSIIKENQHALLRIISTQTAINSIEESIHSIEEIHGPCRKNAQTSARTHQTLDTPKKEWISTHSLRESHATNGGLFHIFKKERHSPLSLIRDMGCNWWRYTYHTVGGVLKDPKEEVFEGDHTVHKETFFSNMREEDYLWKKAHTYPLGTLQGSQTKNWQEAFFSSLRIP